MGSRIDFGVRDRTGRILALVEAKARRGTDSIWAQQFRRNLGAHGALRSDVSFVLATPKALYIWDAGADLDDHPTYEVLASDILGPYFRKIGVDVDDFVDPHVFELIVESWLADAVSGAALPAPEPLRASRLLETLRGGTLVPQVAA